MTIVINLGLHGGRIGGIFITGIFGNFYTKRGGIFDFQNGNSRRPWRPSSKTGTQTEVWDLRGVCLTQYMLGPLQLQAYHLGSWKIKLS